VKKLLEKTLTTMRLPGLRQTDAAATGFPALRHAVSGYRRNFDP
jgi:hypothetical protein